MAFNLANLISKSNSDPTTLYHGSAFQADELKPGYQHTGKLTTWDKFESNAYLYATTDRDSAELLGISSAWEKKYDLASTHIDEGSKTIRLVFYGPPPSLEELKQVTVYLYAIKYTDDWKKNKNPYNNIDTEYKTKATVKGIDERSIVDVPAVLADYNVSVSQR